MHEMPLIRRELCNGCGLCVDVCVQTVLAMIDDIVAIVDAEHCGYCTDCEVVCPTQAIRCPYEIVFAEYYERRETILD